MEELTGQQMLFIKWYTAPKTHTFCNATLAYAEAYDYDLPKDEDNKIKQNSGEYNTCSVNGSRLLGNAKIKALVNKGLVALLNDEEVDARLSEIVAKGQEANSVQAMKIYNDLKQRITKKIDITSAGRPLAGLSDEELDKLSQE